MKRKMIFLVYNFKKIMIAQFYLETLCVEKAILADYVILVILKEKSGDSHMLFIVKNHKNIF